MVLAAKIAMWEAVVAPLALTSQSLIGATGTHFSNTITTGSLLVVIVAAALALVFTLRAHAVSAWKNAAEGEKALRLEREQELLNERTERVAERDEQQKLRHELKNALAESRAEVTLLLAKTDLTALDESSERRAALLEEAADRRHGEIIGAINGMTAGLVDGIMAAIKAGRDNAAGTR